MRNVVLSVFVCLCLTLSPVISSHAATLDFTIDDNHHILGTITIDDYTLQIDALLDNALPTANRVTFTIRDYDTDVFAQALRDCFPDTANMLLEKLSLVNRDQVYATLLPRRSCTSLLPILPYSQTVTDDKLSELQAKCEAFLTKVGLSCHPTPYCCTYFTEWGNRHHLMAIPTENQNTATHIGICYLPAVDGAVSIPYFQIPRYRGQVKDNGNSLFLETNAMFIFSLDGKLEEFQLFNLEMTTSGILDQASFLSWQDALCVTLEEHIRSNRNSFRERIAARTYTVTSIRTAWDSDEAGHGKLGWLISLQGQRPNDASPIGWMSEFDTIFVYGE